MIGMAQRKRIVCGGESGPKSRRMDPAWALSLKVQCERSGTPFFLKQAGTVLGREWGCKQPHGADPSEWPEEFNVQQFPKGAPLPSMQGALFA